MQEKRSNTLIVVIERKVWYWPKIDISHQNFTFYGVSGVYIIKLFLRSKNNYYIRLEIIR